METDSLPGFEQTPLRVRWCHPTPGRLPVILLAVEAILFSSERFQWFPFNENKGWTVLIAIASIALTMVVMLLWLILPSVPVAVSSSASGRCWCCQLPSPSRLVGLRWK